MGKDSKGNLLEMAVLSLLRERPMHPYEISTIMRERGLSFSIKLNFGSLYSVIAGLLVKGFVEVKATEREGNHPERTVYAITEGGEGELFAQLRQLIGEPAREYPRFIAGLAFLAHLEPAEARSLLEKRLIALEAELGAAALRHVDTLGSGVNELFLVELDYSMTMRRAEMEWVRGLIAKIEDGTLAVGVGDQLTWKVFQAAVAAGRDSQG